MAISETTGTETIGATEWSLTTDTSGPDAQGADGPVCAVVDLNALANGDTFRLRFYEVCRSGDTQRLVWEQTYANVQASPIVFSPSFTSMWGWDFTLTKLAGTDRAINWSVRQISIA